MVPQTDPWYLKVIYRGKKKKKSDTFDGRVSIRQQVEKHLRFSGCWEPPSRGVLRAASPGSPTRPCLSGWVLPQLWTKPKRCPVAQTPPPATQLQAPEGTVLFLVTVPARSVCAQTRSPAEAPGCEHVVPDLPCRQRPTPVGTQGPRPRPRGQGLCGTRALRLTQRVGRWRPPRSVRLA